MSLAVLLIKAKRSGLWSWRRHCRPKFVNLMRISFNVSTIYPSTILQSTRRHRGGGSSIGWYFYAGVVWRMHVSSIAGSSPSCNGQMYHDTSFHCGMRRRTTSRSVETNGWRYPGEISQVGRILKGTITSRLSTRGTPWSARPHRGFDHGVGHPLLFLDDTKAYNWWKNNFLNSILKFFSLAIRAVLIFQVLHSIRATHNHSVAFS